MTDTRFVRLNGHRVAYRDEGDPAAEPLLLIHGVAGSSLAWVPLFEHLSATYRVIAPDLLGHGQSDKPRADYSLGAFAVWLRDFLDALDIPAATLVGHSLGGGVALQLVYQHRQYCRRLVLVNSGGLGTDVSMPLRLLSTPGAELLLPFVASRPAVFLGNGVSVLLTRPGIDSTRVQDRWRKYSALADPHGRHAFLRTLRSVVDIRGQTVCALDRLHGSCRRCADADRRRRTGCGDPAGPCAGGACRAAGQSAGDSSMAPGITRCSTARKRLRI